MNIIEKAKKIRGDSRGNLTEMYYREQDKIQDNFSFQDDVLKILKKPEEIIDYLKCKVYTMTFAQGLKRLVIEVGQLTDTCNETDIASKLYDLFTLNNIPVIERVSKVTEKNKRDQIKNWLREECRLSDSQKRNIFIFKISFALSLNDYDVSRFLTKEMGEHDYNCRNAKEVIAFYCHYQNKKYSDFVRLLDEYNKIAEKVERKAVKKIGYTKWFDINIDTAFEDDHRLLSFLCENLHEFTEYSQSLVRTFNTLWEEAYNLTVEMDNYRNIDKKEDEKKKDIVDYGEFYRSLSSFLPVKKMIDKRGHISVKLHVSESVLPEHVKEPLTSTRKNNISNFKDNVTKKDLVLISFYIFCIKRDIQIFRYIKSDSLGINYLADYDTFINETNDILFANGFGVLYPGNRFDNLVMISVMCTFSWDFFESVLRRSFYTSNRSILPTNNS